MQSETVCPTKYDLLGSAQVAESLDSLVLKTVRLNLISRADNFRFHGMIVLPIVTTPHRWDIHISLIFVVMYATRLNNRNLGPQVFSNWDLNSLLSQTIECATPVP